MDNARKEVDWVEVDGAIAWLKLVSAQEGIYDPSNKESYTTIAFKVLDRLVKSSKKSARKEAP